MISFGILEPLRLFLISDYFWPVLLGSIIIFLSVFFLIEKKAKKWYAKNKILVYEKSFFMLKDIMMNGTENIAVKLSMYLNQNLTISHVNILLLLQVKCL